MCECGAPKSECRNPDNAGVYAADSVTCYRQAAVESHTGQPGFKPEPGQRFFAAEIDEELVVRRTFAPLTDTQQQGNEPSKSHEDRKRVQLRTPVLPG